MLEIIILRSTEIIRWKNTSVWEKARERTEVWGCTGGAYNRNSHWTLPRHKKIVVKTNTVLACFPVFGANHGENWNKKENWPRKKWRFKKTAKENWGVSGENPLRWRMGEWEGNIFFEADGTTFRAGSDRLRWMEKPKPRKGWIGWWPLGHRTNPQRYGGGRFASSQFVLINSVGDKNLKSSCRRKKIGRRVESTTPETQRLNIDPKNGKSNYWLHEICHTVFSPPDTLHRATDTAKPKMCDRPFRMFVCDRSFDVNEGQTLRDGVWTRRLGWIEGEGLFWEPKSRDRRRDRRVSMGAKKMTRRVGDWDLGAHGKQRKHTSSQLLALFGRGGMETSDWRNILLKIIIVFSPHFLPCPGCHEVAWSPPNNEPRRAACLWPLFMASRNVLTMTHFF